MKHIWSRFIAALSVDYTYEGIRKFLISLGEGDRINKKEYKALCIEGAGPSKEVPKATLRERGVASFYTRFSKKAHSLFADIDIRETIYLLLYMKDKPEVIAEYICDNFPVMVTDEDIKNFLVVLKEVLGERV